MKKIITAIIAISLTAILLAGCITPNPPEPETDSPAIPEAASALDPAQAGLEYKKITSIEAQSMMSDDVIILDVRTQEEYDGGHILNAVVLPHDEIREKAESVIGSKDRTVLIYCRSGRRSEIASRELIDMGYSNVFDFGGIIDWPGEIVR